LSGAKGGQLILTQSWISTHKRKQGAYMVQEHLQACALHAADKHSEQVVDAALLQAQFAQTKKHLVVLLALFQTLA